MQHTHLENIFNKWDVCTFGKCKMDVKSMVYHVAYAANVLPELEALIKSEPSLSWAHCVSEVHCGRDARRCYARHVAEEEGAGARRSCQCERSLSCQVAVEAEQ